MIVPSFKHLFKCAASFVCCIASLAAGAQVNAADERLATNHAKRYKDEAVMLKPSYPSVGSVCQKVDHCYQNQRSETAAWCGLYKFIFIISSGANDGCPLAFTTKTTSFKKTRMDDGKTALSFGFSEVLETQYLGLSKRHSKE